MTETSPSGLQSMTIELPLHFWCAGVLSIDFWHATPESVQPNNVHEQVNGNTLASSGGTSAMFEQMVECCGPAHAAGWIQQAA